MKIDKPFSFRGRGGGFAPDHPRGFSPGPRWGSVPGPPFRLALRALAMVRPTGKSWIRHWSKGVLKLF